MRLCCYNFNSVCTILWYSLLYVWLCWWNCDICFGLLTNDVTFGLVIVHEIIFQESCVSANNNILILRTVKLTIFRSSRTPYKDQFEQIEEQYILLLLHLHKHHRLLIRSFIEWQMLEQHSPHMARSPFKISPQKWNQFSLGYLASTILFCLVRK